MTTLCPELDGSEALLRELRDAPPFQGTSMSSLAEQLPIEQARVRVVLGHYKEIGPVGAFGAAMIEQSLRAADQAAASGDVIAMLRAFNDLQSITG